MPRPLPLPRLARPRPDVPGSLSDTSRQQKWLRGAFGQRGPSPVLSVEAGKQPQTPGRQSPWLPATGLPRKTPASAGLSPMPRSLRCTPTPGFPAPASPPRAGAEQVGECQCVALPRPLSVLREQPTGARTRLWPALLVSGGLSGASVRSPSAPAPFSKEGGASLPLCLCPCLLLESQPVLSTGPPAPGRTPEVSMEGILFGIKLRGSC